MSAHELRNRKMILVHHTVLWGPRFSLYWRLTVSPDWITCKPRTTITRMSLMLLTHRVDSVVSNRSTSSRSRSWDNIFLEPRYKATPIHPRICANHPYSGLSTKKMMLCTQTPIEALAKGISATSIHCHPWIPPVAQPPMPIIDTPNSLSRVSDLFLECSSRHGPHSHIFSELLKVVVLLSQLFHRVPTVTGDAVFNERLADDTRDAWRALAHSLCFYASWARQ
jgi:hypothetical protein